MAKLKVLWICEISNSAIREHLDLYNPKIYWKNIVKKIIGRKSLLNYFDRGVWNTLAIEEYEKHDDIELHVVSTASGMKKNFEMFVLNGIHYYFINVIYPLRLRNRFSIDYYSSFPYTRKMVKHIIDMVEPDIINMIGAENPEYAVCAQDIDKSKYPFVLSMQTALSDPDFKKMYPISEEQYQQRVSIEQHVFRAASYIATDASWYREVASWYNKEAMLIRYFLCSRELCSDINLNQKKEFDFVYYALSIEKGAEDAIRSLYWACREEPNISLNIIGRYSAEYYSYITNLINDLGLESNVTFSGFFERQIDALNQVMKSKAAIVPIKVDIVSGTVREPMAMGLPVVTYITKGTPALNRQKETVLLAEIGDFQQMGRNMVRLYRDKDLSENLVKNAKEFVKNNWVTKDGINFNISLYRAIYEHFHNNISFDNRYTKAIY